MNNIQYVEGKVAEKRFVERVYGSDTTEAVIWATKKQDIEEHWDFKDRGCGQQYDVKAIKKVNRYDSGKNDNIHFVELSSVYEYNGKEKPLRDGWLYGRAHFIVFETNKYWLIVDREILLNYLHWEDLEISNSPDLYKIYTRKNRVDRMVLVSTLDLMFIAKKIIEK